MWEFVELRLWGQTVAFGDTTGSNWILLINEGISVVLLLQVNVHIHIADSTFSVSLNLSLPECGSDQ